MSASSSLRVLRSIGAVLAGMIPAAALSVGTDQVLHSTGVFPPWGEPMADGLFLLPLAYRCLFAIGGSYVAARLAASRPMLHAVVLGVVHMAANVAGLVATWNKGPEFGPHWYPIALGLLSLPCGWAGGKLLRAESPVAAPERAAASESSHA